MILTADILEARLEERSIGFDRIAVGTTAFIVVSQLGGRVYGPFWTGSEISENWAPDAFAIKDAFAELHRSGGWNVGGERIWVGPEISYMIPDRDDYWGSYTMPPDIDPGSTSFASSSNGVHIGRTLDIESFTDPGKRQSLGIEQFVRAVPHPLRHVRALAGLASRVEVAGYSQRVQLRHLSGDPILAESWNLNQIRTPGRALIPTTPQPQVTDYYEPVGALLDSRDRGVTVALTGADRFKVGFASAQTYGRLGFVRADLDGSYRLAVRISPNDPGGEYSEEPDFAPGLRGDSLHLYNDDGGLGGFAELESRGIPIGSEEDRVESSDEFATWWFRGAIDDIDEIATALLGLSVRTTGQDPT
jgi:hypothetical protein